MTTETFACHQCGTSCERPLARGQKPKWCSPQCSDLAKKARAGTCEFCGADFYGHGARFCSRECGNKARRKTKPTPRTHDQVAEVWRSRRSQLRAAVEDADPPAVMRAVRERVTVDEHGCWIWSGRINDGYPTVKIGKRTHQVHRLILEAKHEASLGSQAAHHMCSVSRCVNPEHLQPVTHRENVAEMLARQSYLSRIRELEAALAQVSPDHPLLAAIRVA